MDSRDWADIKEIFSTALALAPADREAFLARLNQPLRDEIVSLLFAYEEDSKALDEPLLTRSGMLLSKAIEAQFEREQIGRYRIRGEIGRGGMGAVYRATRDDKPNCEYAVKVIRPELNQTLLVRRFRQEMRILQTLSHPFIASVVDAGTSEDGEPYFVMDLIDGLPVNEYCDANMLGIKERLTLFEKICQAAGAAHRAGIIHRDLKPSNVLVTTAGEPKLLDFGIAKVLHPEDQQHTVPLTGTVQHFLTPEYASPEQIRGESATPAADVYSLGMLLYELLTGQRPYDVTKRSPDVIARSVLEQPPIRPSSRISQLQSASRSAGNSATAELISTKRATTPHILKRRLRGKLDDIVLHALAKDAKDRYQSAEELAGDIGNFLHNRPITAPRENVITRTRKSISPRLYLSVAVLAGFCLILAGITRYVRHRDSMLPTLSVSKLTSSGNVARVAISPDGRYLAFALSSNHGDSLWLRERSSGNEREIVSTGASFGELEFSPDSTAIYVLRYDAIGFAVHRLSVKGGELSTVLRGSATERIGAFGISHRGDQIALITVSAGDLVLEAAHLKSGLKRIVAHLPAGDMRMDPSHLCFTADDSHVLLPAERLKGDSGGTILSIRLSDGRIQRSSLDLVPLEVLSLNHDRLQVAISLTQDLLAIAAAKSALQKAAAVNAFDHQVNAEIGSVFTSAQATLLNRLAGLL